jgi:hypothetical protein
MNLAIAGFLFDNSKRLFFHELTAAVVHVRLGQLIAFLELIRAIIHVRLWLLVSLLELVRAILIRCDFHELLAAALIGT